MLQRLPYHVAMMTSTLDTVIAESDGKTPNETSLRAIQSQAQFNGPDDADARDSNDSNHGFSCNDRGDMCRMGKVQELRVSIARDCIWF